MVKIFKLSIIISIVLNIFLKMMYIVECFVDMIYMMCDVYKGII